MPKLRERTIEAHRHAIREAVLDATEEEVATQGLARATMTRIAERAGIGRATLYKYFPDVSAIVTAAHHRHVEAHLRKLNELVAAEAPDGDRLRRVLAEYARICYFRAAHGDTDVSALVHRSAEVVTAERRLTELFTRVLADAQQSGVVRVDVDAGTLATYCLHAVGAAGHDVDHAQPGVAADAIVRLTLDALR